MNCIELLSAFFDDIGISHVSYCSSLEKVASSGLSDFSEIQYQEGKDVITKILTDVYCLNAQNVKKIANSFAKHFVAIGRREKALIKHYLDYRDSESFSSLMTVLSDYMITEPQLSLIFESAMCDLSSDAVSALMSNWAIAENNSDDAKKFDYLQGIYTRLIHYFNEDTLSLKEIFDYNAPFISEELNPEFTLILERFCDSKKQPANIARKSFCDKYEEILSEMLRLDSAANKLESVMNIDSAAGTPFADYSAEQFKLVVIRIDQKLFDCSSSEADFWNRVLSLVYYSYRLLDNHRTLAISIENIFVETKTL